MRLLWRLVVLFQGGGRTEDEQPLPAVFLALDRPGGFVALPNTTAPFTAVPPQPGWNAEDH